uniref:Uncharacterized protein n=1 Tax=Parascaris equorum TaxID=6256 RepID=A0A914RDV2_PAREQ
LKLRRYTFAQKWRTVHSNHRIIQTVFRKKKNEFEQPHSAAAPSALLADSNNELMGLYKPRTQETKQTYEAILAYIQDALGDQVRWSGRGFFLSQFVECDCDGTFSLLQ